MADRHRMPRAYRKIVSDDIAQHFIKRRAKSTKAGRKWLRGYRERRALAERDLEHEFGGDE